MANILGKITDNGKYILEVDSDPSAGGGTPAPIGSLALLSSGGVGSAYLKTAAADTAWTVMETATNAWTTLGNTLTGASPGVPNEFFGSNNDYDVIEKRNGIEYQRFSTAAVSLDSGSSLYLLASKSLAFGVRSTGSIAASGNGSVANGSNVNAGSITASGVGSSASGDNLDNGSIVASGNGSSAHGLNANNGSITASGLGAFALGRTLNAGAVLISGNGSFGFGNTAAPMTVSGGGAMGFGQLQANATGMSVAGPASLVFGQVNGTAGTAISTTAGGLGSLVFGQASTASTISASASAAMVKAISSNSAAVLASGAGAIAGGTADGASSALTASGAASIAHGRVLAASSLISSGLASINLSIADTASSATASGGASFVNVRATNSASVSASNAASHASGVVDGAGSSISSSAVASMARGYITAAASILSSGDGSLALGRADGAGSSISASGAGSLVAGHSVAGFAISSSGNGSLAIGEAASGPVAVSGAGALAAGDDLVLDAALGQALGQGHSNQSYLSMVLGRYSANSPNNPSSWVSTDPLFVLGNGASSGARANAFEVDKDGRVIESASLVSQAVRLVAAADSISARSDRTILFDTAGAGGALSLPAGEDGLIFMFSPSGSGGASYSLVPNGGDLLDPNVISSLSQGIEVGIQFKSGVWYALYSNADSGGDLFFEVTTSGASASTIDIPIPLDANKMLKVSAVVRQTAGTDGAVGDGAGFVRTANASNVAGVVALQFEQNDYTYNTFALDLSASVSTTNIRYTATGVANRDLTWDIKVEVIP